MRSSRSGTEAARRACLSLIVGELSMTKSRSILVTRLVRIAVVPGIMSVRGPGGSPPEDEPDPLVDAAPAVAPAVAPEALPDEPLPEPAPLPEPPCAPASVPGCMPVLPPHATAADRSAANIPPTTWRRTILVLPAAPRGFSRDGRPRRRPSPPSYGRDERPVAKVRCRVERAHPPPVPGEIELGHRPVVERPAELHHLLLVCDAQGLRGRGGDDPRGREDERRLAASDAGDAGHRARDPLTKCGPRLDLGMTDLALDPPACDSLERGQDVVRRRSAPAHRRLDDRPQRLVLRRELRQELEDEGEPVVLVELGEEDRLRKRTGAGCEDSHDGRVRLRMALARANEDGAHVEALLGEPLAQALGLGDAGGRELVVVGARRESGRLAVTDE